MRRFAPIAVLVCLFLLLTSQVFAEESRNIAPPENGNVVSAPTGSSFAPDRVLVKFTPEALRQAEFRDATNKSAGPDAPWTGLASLDAALNRLDISNLTQMHGALKFKAAAERLGADRWYRVDVTPGTDIEAAVAELSVDPSIESAIPDVQVFLTATPTDPLFPANWGHNNTAQLPGGASHNLPGVGTVGFDSNAKSAWNEPTGYGIPGVIIAIVDSGVDSTHPDLVQVAGYDFGDGDSNPDDDSADPGHGTACSGVAAATANNSLGAVGIAGGCSIMPLKISNSAGALYLSAAADALYFAADNGADVASMSFGGGGVSNLDMDTAINYAFNAGVVLLAATGNEDTGSISYPANNENVIAVGAASPCGERKASSGSANGTSCDGEYWWGSNYGSSNSGSRFAVTILAPTILPTTDIQGSGGYAPGDYSNYFNGTSCATPYAAGVCALIKSANPTYGPATIRNILTSTATDVVSDESGVGWDLYSGHGMVDAAAALGATVILPPEANFEATPTSGCAPLTVDFTDLSAGDITSWNWVFGDGNTSDQQNPTHIYAAAGTYDVSLYTTGPEGTDSKTVQNFITAGVAPVAAMASGPATGPAPLTVNFLDLSTGATGRVWDFGDGGSDTAQYPAHTYTIPGTYTVTLIATGGCAPDTLIQVDYVTVTSLTAPVAAFSGDPISGCAPLEVAFADESTGDVSSWAWTFGDGGSSSDQNPTYIYGTPGTYSVELTVTGPGGGDTATMTDYVTVVESVTADMSYDAGEGLAPLTVNFQDESLGSPTTWLWDFGDATTDTVQNPSHIYTTVDTFTVTLIVGNECSVDTLVLDDAVRVFGISGVENVIPTRYSLGQNVPNPFNPMTTIYFELPEASAVRLRVYDISGRLVRSLIGGESMGAGRQEAVWNGRNDAGQQVSAGVYFYLLNAGEFNDTKRMTLVK